MNRFILIFILVYSTVSFASSSDSFSVCQDEINQLSLRIKSQRQMNQQEIASLIERLENLQGEEGKEDPVLLQIYRDTRQCFENLTSKKSELNFKEAALAEELDINNVIKLAIVGVEEETGKQRQVYESLNFEAQDVCKQNQIGTTLGTKNCVAPVVPKPEEEDICEGNQIGTIVGTKSCEKPKLNIIASQICEGNTVRGIIGTKKCYEEVTVDEVQASQICSNNKLGTKQGTKSCPVITVSVGDVTDSEIDAVLNALDLNKDLNYSSRINGLSFLKEFTRSILKIKKRLKGFSLAPLCSGNSFSSCSRLKFSQIGKLQHGAGIFRKYRNKFKNSNYKEVSLLKSAHQVISYVLYENKISFNQHYIQLGPYRKFARTASLTHLNLDDVHSLDAENNAFKIPMNYREYGELVGQLILADIQYRTIWGYSQKKVIGIAPVENYPYHKVQDSFK